MRQPILHLAGPLLAVSAAAPDAAAIGEISD
jgi:hypothetical protein